MKILKGKKTYGLAVIGAVIFIAARVGWLNAEAELTIYKALGILSVATIRDAIS